MKFWLRRQALAYGDFSEYTVTEELSRQKGEFYRCAGLTLACYETPAQLLSDSHFLIRQEEKVRQKSLCVETERDELLVTVISQTDLT